LLKFQGSGKKTVSQRYLSFILHSPKQKRPVTSVKLNLHGICVVRYLHAEVEKKMF